MQHRTMESYKIQLVAIVSLILVFPNTQGWGEDGHFIVCKIAQSRLSNSAAEAVKNLLPESAQNDLASLCLWPDEIKRDARYRWSATLHFADTPDSLCNFQYDSKSPYSFILMHSASNDPSGALSELGKTTQQFRDCKDLSTGEKGQCVVGAINNYTNQLLNYGSVTKYNLTEALLFLSHFVGDIHQPLHCGFVSDLGGNRVAVNWYNTVRNLHRVWDDDIIETAEERFYDSNRTEYINAIQQNITKAWADQVKGWENCSPNKIPCPDIYASESIEEACQWAYKGVSVNSNLQDEYFLTRLPIVTLRLAQGGVRLAATLNRIFGTQYSAAM
ncbi:hypothetical protein RIF29_16377 [Crotalaria pallida]|uniref:Aspergillus nuclease S1 n=1 Tax=Crotalaria pallida TaxID=3830 RepID=A0AAN9FF93_CROPI